MSDERNSAAYRTALQDSSDESIRNSGTIAQGGSATLNDRSGLYVAILALALAGIALGLWLNQSQIIDAKVQAAVAQANATASTAETHARVALDKVEDFRAKLAEKGIKVTLDGH